MHTLGKVLLGFIVVLAIAAAILTSMLYDAQASWQKKVEEKLAARDQRVEELRKKEIVVRDLEAEINRRTNPWGRAWEIGPEQIQLLDANEGIVRLGIGLNQQLGLRESSQGKPLPPVYLFAKQADGTARYLGAFRLTTVEADQAAAQLIRRPYPGEVETWNAPAGIRVWESIPGNWRALEADLQAVMATAMQDVIDQQGRLQAAQERLVPKSEEQLERRLQQLGGKPQALEGATQDVLDGLVVALQKEETNRDQQLAELDRLRHEYNAKYNELMALLDENRQLEQQLPQPPAESGSPDNSTAEDVAGPTRR